MGENHAESDADLAGRDGRQLGVGQDPAQHSDRCGVVDAVDGGAAQGQRGAGAQIAGEVRFGEEGVEEGGCGALVAQGQGLGGGGLSVLEPPFPVAQYAAVVCDLHERRVVQTAQRLDGPLVQAPAPWTGDVLVDGLLRQRVAEAVQHRPGFAQHRRSQRCHQGFHALLRLQSGDARQQGLV
ncbi:hypothetical protein [Streptomyces bicolor]|uniref:hypothetical protein n=1 Tax=Streptomyces bicolor TaxID=66874 RepID=UPI001F38ADEE|nr:hypothetical protein [Streptomyces bicolor]